MRALSAFIGTFLGVAIIIAIFTMSGVEISYFINPLGIIVVLGGTLSAIFLSYSLEDVLRVVSIVGRIFLRRYSNMKLIGQNLIDFADQCRKTGIPERDTKKIHPFLNDCLVLINDGYDIDEMREVLEQRIITSYDTEDYEVGIIKSMAKHPPAFGMIGTVVGLIALLSTLGGEASLDKIGPYLAVALTTTLYGLMISSFIFKPIADNLEIRMDNNMKQRQMVLEVALHIKRKASYLIVQDTVNSLLPPKHQIAAKHKGINESSAA